MRLIERPFGAGALLEQERHGDARGFFARIFCREALRPWGGGFAVAQANVSRSIWRHTLRGLHLQAGTNAERKVVQCLAGAIFDVIVDLRAESPTFRHWRGFELSADNGRLLIIPEGFAHGFLTLTPDVLMAYLVSTPYAPEAERGFRFDDPAFAIDWPARPKVISPRDLGHPPFTPAGLAAETAECAFS